MWMTIMMMMPEKQMEDFLKSNGNVFAALK
jgi:hypothetical protein